MGKLRPTRTMARSVGARSLYLGPVALQALTSIVCLAILTRSLDLSEYGRLAVFITLQQSLTVLVALGLPSAIASVTAQEGAYWRPISVYPVLAASAVVTVAAAAHSTTQGICLGLVTLFSAIATLQLARLRGLGHGGRWALLSLAMGPVSQAAGTGSVLIQPSLDNYLYAWVATSGAAALIAFVTTPREWRRGPWSRASYAIVRQTLPLLGSALASMMSRVGDRIIIGAILGAAAAGAYQAPYAIGNFNTIVVGALFSFHVSPLMRGDRGARRRFLTEAVLLSALGLAVVPVGVLVLLPIEFHSATSVLVASTSAVAAVPMAASNAMEARLIHLGLSRAVGSVGIAVAVIYLAAVAIVLLAGWGIVAVACCTPAIYVLSWTSFRTLMRRHRRVGMLEVP